jgi:cellulose biosynthesis protein BcsQ
MRRRQLAVCDREPEYTCRFTEYANQRREPLFTVHGFTGSEELADYARENTVDILLLSPEFLEEFRKTARPGQVICLSDQQYLEEDPGCPVIYKFQSCDQILRQVMDLYAQQAPAAPMQALRLEELKLLGIYSPVGRTGKTSFALALGKELARRKRTLYLNLEEYSGFQALYPYGDGQTLSELMYFLKQNRAAFVCKVESVVQQIGGLDYIPPLKSPVELRHISARDWESLLEALAQGTNYEVVILDLSGAVNGLFELLERCDGIYTPVNTDAAAQAKLLQYEDTLKLLEIEEILQKTKRFRLSHEADLEAIAIEEGRRWGNT